MCMPFYSIQYFVLDFIWANQLEYKEWERVRLKQKKKPHTQNAIRKSEEKMKQTFKWNYG